MVELLIASGADVELHTEVPPVEVAVLYDKRDIFKLLIAAGAKYDISHTLRLGMMPETRVLLEADPCLRGSLPAGRRSTTRSTAKWAGIRTPLCTRRFRGRWIAVRSVRNLNLNRPLRRA